MTLKKIDAKQKQCQREWYQRNKARLRAKQLAYWKAHREQVNKTNRDYRARHPIEIKATKLARKVPIGNQCEICGTTEDLQKHHPDYSKPLEIVTLCRQCHMGKLWT